MKSLIIVLFALISLKLGAQVRFLQVNDLEDYELVLKTARQSNTMLLVAMHDGGGAFRQMYIDGVFDDASLEAEMRPFTNIAIDESDEMGERFQQLFVTRQLPTFFIMNDQEFVMDVLQGYQDIGTLKSALYKASRAPYRYDSLLVKYNNQSLSNKEWVELIELYALNFDFGRTVVLAQEFLNAHEEADLLHKPQVSILSQYGLNLETPYPLLVKSNAATIEKALPKFNLEEYLQTAIEFNLDRAILGQDSLILAKIDTELIGPPLVSADSSEFLKLSIYREYAWQSKRFETYAATFIKAMQSRATSISANLLYQEAYETVENFNSRSALKGAMAMAEASDNKQNSFRAKMLKAYIAYLQKDLPLSNTLLQNARPQIKTPEQLRSLEKLQALIEEDSKKKS